MINSASTLSKMGLVKKIAATILVISFVVFVALFGRLPALR